MSAAEVVGYDGHSPVPLIGDVFSDEQQELYLEALREGVGLDFAARRIGSTATQMRRFANRDEAWRQRRDEAYEIGQQHYRDRLKDSAQFRATTRSGAYSSRIHEIELATHVPGYEHLRRDRISVDAKIDARTLVISDFSPDKLDAMSQEELMAAKAALALLGGEIVDAEVEELPADDAG